MMEACWLQSYDTKKIPNSRCGRAIAEPAGRQLSVRGISNAKLLHKTSRSMKAQRQGRT